ncbi:hypothetical protein [Methylobacterium sp. WL9]|uniref:hypothetical protein n=1 Tax=Methylobacterium sp. WL9 TaxID=2603898 RepID=UPI001AED8ED8|nr:hypothetical protein [Methylobacterium sp. WL9]
MMMVMVMPVLEVCRALVVVRPMAVHDYVVMVTVAVAVDVDVILASLEAAAVVLGRRGDRSED